MTSSWVGPKQKSAPLRSLKRSSSGPYFCQRPLSCHSSAGVAAGNLNARPHGEKSKQGRSIWLLSTADLVGPHFLQSAGRYSWGALLAPGFYADRTDSRIAEFTALYEASFGRAPTALDAYAFDAAWLIRSAVDSGARSRRDVASALATTKLVGLTGPIAFDSGHRRRDDGIVYEVVQVRNDQYELKARR